MDSMIEEPSTDGSSAAGEWARNWPVVLAAAAGVALSTVHIYSLGIFIAPLEGEFGWSRAQISSGLLINSVVTVVCSPFMGLLIDRIGPRRVALCAAPAFCVLVACLSLAGPSIWSWWLVWAGLAFSIIGLTMTVWTTAISSVFTRSRGLALSVTLCGTGISSSFTPLLSNALSSAFGWRGAYLGLALFWSVLLLPLLFFFFTSAKDRRRLDTPGMQRVVLPTLTGLTAREGFRSPRFYKLAIAGLCIALVVISFVVNMVPILSSMGIARGSAAGIASYVGVASIVGRLSGGYLIDRINGNIVAAISVLLPTLACALLLSMPGEVLPASCAAVLVGLSLGAELDAVAYLSTRHLGLRSFGVLFGTIAGILGLATGLGPLLVSYSFDITRSYVYALWAYIPLCMLAALLFLSLGRYPDHAENLAA
jgi:MFS family permease